MTAAELASLVAPPPSSERRSASSWAAVEAAVGTALPTDYKDFIDVFGTGRLANFIWIFDPFSEARYLNLVEQAPRHLSELRRLASDFGEKLQFDLYPDAGGLLPLGVTDNGDLLHWLTKGRPNDWHVVVGGARSPEHQVFQCDLTTFLSRIVTQTEICVVFPRDFPPREVNFEWTVDP